MDFTCPTFRRRLLESLVLLSTLIFINCAEIGPPPGGEEDKKAPSILVSVPATGATSVAPDNTISITFSERIQKPEGKKAVFISPRPSSEPELQWKSDRLTIDLPDSFGVDQTYIISLSTDIVDMRRNRLDSANTVAFSTGSTIDSGRISGVVLVDKKPAPGILVALYDSSQFAGENAIDSIYGEYLTQTTAKGTFAFDYLPSKHFRLIAFEDINRDERFNPGREKFAVPDRVINVGSDIPLDNLDMNLTTRDTAALKIVSAAYSEDRIIRVRLSSEISFELLKRDPQRVVLRPSTDTTSIVFGLAMLSDERLHGSEFKLYAGALDEGVYVLDVAYDQEMAPVRFDSLRVRPREDKNPPAVFFQPDARPQFVDELNMRAVISEPLDTTKLTETTFQLFDEADGQLDLSWTWEDLFHVNFTSEDIETGARYRLRLTEFEISDLAGNTPGDSLKEYVITTLNPDSLGTASGSVEVGLADRRQAPVQLTFTKIENQQTFDLPVEGREFKIELPAGKYLARGFVDVDSSGVRGLGSAVPYRLAESAMTYSDTIAVRARFETTDILFKFK